MLANGIEIYLIKKKTKSVIMLAKDIKIFLETFETKKAFCKSIINWTFFLFSLKMFDFSNKFKKVFLGAQVNELS